MEKINMGKTLLIVLLFVVASSFSAFAADVCVGPSSSGDGSGSDWNNIAAWSTLSFTRGNNYYLQDGIYGSKTLGTTTSGSTYIYLKKGTESAHGAAVGWSSVYGDGTATFSSATLSVTTSYWDISGVAGGGPGAWKTGHGIVMTSSAGDSNPFISITSGVTNLMVRHVYFNQVGNTEVTSAMASAIYCNGDLSNSIFEYNYMENLGGLPFLLRGGSGNIIQYNYTGNICGASAYNVNNHCETMVVWSMSDSHIRWNYFAECPSSGGIVHNSGNTSDSIRIYGNVFSNGYPIQCNSGPCTNWRVFNNTFQGTVSGFIAGDGTRTNWLAHNNIMYGTANFQNLTVTHNYNWYSNATGASCTLGKGANENICAGCSGGCDSVTTTLNPFVNSSGTLPEDFRLSNAISGWPGTDVCALDSCSGEKKYNIDAFGKIRGADGVWDRGAYEYTGNVLKIPFPPLGIGVN